MTKANGTLERSININRPPSWPNAIRTMSTFGNPPKNKAILEVIRSVIECILFPTK